MRPWLLKLALNFFPCYRRTGARIEHIDYERREVTVKLPLNWKTRGYFGSLFGGSMYGAVDPVYMVMLNKLLGPEFEVWDKAASIRFRKPGRTDLYARFSVTKDELDGIRGELEHATSVDRCYRVDLKDESGEVYASIDKTLHIRRREK